MTHSFTHLLTETWREGTLYEIEYKAFNIPLTFTKSSESHTQIVLESISCKIKIPIHECFLATNAPQQTICCTNDNILPHTVAAHGPEGAVLTRTGSNIPLR